VKKKINENLRRWHEVLSEALWVHQTSKHGATRVTPFKLVYGQETVLLVEINLQDVLSADEYVESMMERIDNAPESRLAALLKIEKEKLRAAKVYNRRVRENSFQLGDLVWKMILPVGSKDKKFGKWSPSWEGPFKIIGITPGNSYFIDIGRQENGECIEWEVLEKVHVQRMAGCVAWVRPAAGLSCHGGCRRRYGGLKLTNCGGLCRLREADLDKRLSPTVFSALSLKMPENRGACVRCRT
jgi:hypothetical protein